jgi:hypothetical protein
MNNARQTEIELGQRLTAEMDALLQRNIDSMRVAGLSKSVAYNLVLSSLAGFLVGISAAGGEKEGFGIAHVEAAISLFKSGEN